MTSVVRCRATARERGLDLLLGAGIQRAGRFVQDQDARVLQDGARDGDPLLLAARQLQAAFADPGVVTVRQAQDEVVHLGEPRRLLDLLLARAGAAIGDVVADRIVEQHGVLRHHADRRAQAVLGHVADVLPVDQDAALGHVVEPEQQAADGGFARARSARRSPACARRDGEIDAFRISRSGR